MKHNQLMTIYGRNMKNMAYTLCQKIDLASIIPKGIQVGLKPNYVLSKPASEGATTHPEILEGIIVYLHDNDIHDINIMESAWVGDSTIRAFKTCGAQKLAAQYNVKLTDLKIDDTIAIEPSPMAKITSP